MPVSQYLPFGTGGVAGSPNTLSYSSYAALTTLIGNGFLSGIARSEQVNTVLRQATVGVAGVAQLIADHGALDALDDGSPANFKAALKGALDNLMAAQQFWKTGDVKGTINPTVPDGWLKLNGQVVSRTTYAALFALLGTTHGAGDGSTTFQLPDYRGEFLRGWDDERGVDSGRALGTFQADMFKSHTHDMGSEAGGAGNFATPVDSSGTDETQTGNPTQPTGGSETRPRNMAVLWLIKT